MEIFRQVLKAPKVREIHVRQQLNLKVLLTKSISTLVLTPFNYLALNEDDQICCVKSSCFSPTWHKFRNLRFSFLFFFFLNLAVLGVSLKERSTKDVEKAFQDIARKLNLSESPPMQNLQSVPEMKNYLMKNNLRCW